MCHITPAGDILAIRKDTATPTQKAHLIEVYRVEGDAMVLTKKLPMPDESKLLWLESSPELLVVGFTSKQVFVMDLKTEEFVHVFHTFRECESPPYVDGRSVYFVPKKQTLFKLDYSKCSPKEMQTLTLLKVDSTHPALTATKVASKAFSPYYLGMVVQESEGRVTMLKQGSIETFRKSAHALFSPEGAAEPVQYKEISRQKLTCCGVDISYV